MNLTPEELAAKFTEKAASLPREAARVLGRQGLLLETKIKGNASGRPGPNAPTGDYRRSWNTVPSQEGTVLRSTTGTNKPQGRRLEYGFMNMTDILGRTFQQPPYPHVGPAVSAQEAVFMAAFEKLMTI